VTASWNAEKRAWTSADARPFTASVIIDADAFEMAQPLPVNATSATRSASRRT